MPENETIFKPKYSGRSAFSLYLWPISLIAFVFFAVDMIRTFNFYAEGLLALMFALAAFSPPFIYFRSMQFGEALIVSQALFPAGRGDPVQRHHQLPIFQLENRQDADCAERPDAEEL